VTEAGNGRDGLRLAIKLKPELVILDVHLREISSLEVCKRIKQDPSTAEITVLHLSTTRLLSSAMVNEPEQCADVYLTESVDPQVLVATIKALLRTRKAEEAVTILSVQENERRHIARELHDDLTQRLSLLAMRLEAIRRTPPAAVQNVDRKRYAMRQNTRPEVWSLLGCLQTKESSTSPSKMTVPVLRQTDYGKRAGSDLSV
jgi:DNA-binding response OmpR family regulator